ncbi:TerB family tellurite resistance protein [uncultured Alloprevotella sp.]|uniref:TerB family tellurite resistance protein n=1 Tax=uncultured Alloprevotella sp. TaxID=1283315 RepID=UPI00325FBB0D
MEGRQLQFLELYRMVLADGIAHPKEMETLYRIGVENYGLTNEQITKEIAEESFSTFIPETPEDKIKLLYELALIAWADGVIEESEKKLLKRYAILFGIKEELSDEFVNFLLKKVQDNVSENEITNHFEF